MVHSFPHSLGTSIMQMLVCPKVSCVVCGLVLGDPHSSLSLVLGPCRKTSLQNCPHAGHHDQVRKLPEALTVGFCPQHLLGNILMVSEMC